MRKNKKMKRRKFLLTAMGISIPFLSFRTLELKCPVCVGDIVIVVDNKDDIPSFQARILDIIYESNINEITDISIQVEECQKMPELFSLYTPDGILISKDSEIMFDKII